MSDGLGSVPLERLEEDGRRIPTVARSRRGDRGELHRRARQQGLKLDALTPVALDNGGPCDYGMAVEGLLAREGLLDLTPPSEPELAGVSAETF